MRSVAEVQAAEMVFGIGGVDPSALYGQMFAREKRAVRSERDRVDLDDC